MQAVISRVHRIVTTHTGGDADGSASSAPARSPTQSAAAMTLSTLGGGASSSPSPSSSSFPPTPTHAPAHVATTSLSVGASPVASPAHRQSRVPVSPVVAAAAATAGLQTASEPVPVVPVVVKPEIQLAVERLQYAMLLGERKKAVKALHELARSYITTGGDSGEFTSSYDSRSPRQQKPQATADHRVLGETAIPVVLNALISDPRDTELMEAMLEFLQEIVAKSPSTASSLLQQMGSSARGGGGGGPRSSYSMQGSPTSGIQICLQLLQDPSPWIRGPTITLVKYIQEASQKEFGAAVLECKEGLRRLLEVVEDKREHIRDAALQVLVKLTEREKMVQQFLAFEDGFVRLFQIMEIEGLVEGSSVISDCLQIVNNMVRDNLMTQTLLREMPFLESHLPQLLSLPGRDAMLDEEGSVTSTKSYQKKRALKLGLQLVRFLVAGIHEGVPEAKLDELALRERSRKDAELSQIQSFIGRQRELMGAIGEIACCQNEDLTDLQLQALDLLELLGSSNGGNQIILVNLQSKPSHLSVLSEFVRLDFADEETPVSAAATSLLDSLFQNNETTKMAIFQQLNAPPPMDDDEEGAADIPPAVPAGRVLLDALIKNSEEIMKGGVKSEQLRSRTIVAWKACHRLTSLLSSSDFCKDLALRIPSEYENPDAQAVAGGRFLTRCLRLLGCSPTNANNKEYGLPASVFQVKVSVLCLLIQWCLNCTKAVQEIVGSVANLSILVELFVKEDQSSSSPQLISEMTHLRGLAAMLLGCCLEFLIDSRQQELQQLQGLPTSPTPSRPSGQEMTRGHLLEMISKRIGLQRFTDAFVQFQQAPLVVACTRGSRNQTSRNVLSPRAIYGDEEDDEQADSHGSYLFSLYEKPFIGIFRDMADKIQKRIITIYTCADSGSHDDAGSSSVNNAMSAYQDLIRIQDQQHQDLEKQLAELQAALSNHNGVSGGNDATTNHEAVDNAIENAKRETATAFASKLDEVERLHAREKEVLEGRLKELETAALERETRYNGLTVAFEQLETDYNKLKAAPGPSYESSAATNSSQPSQATDSQLSKELESLSEKCYLLEQELKEQTQLRVQGERHFSLDRNELEMHHLRLQKEIEDLRMALTQRDEQIRENTQMLEAMDAGQAILKKENEKLKEQLKANTNSGRPDEMQQHSHSHSHVSGEVSHSDVDALHKELASKQAELELARETHREFECRFIRQLQGESATPLDESSHHSKHSVQAQASKVVDHMKEHGAAKEIFDLLGQQNAKARELHQRLEQAIAEKSVLEEQHMKSREEYTMLEQSLKELESREYRPEGGDDLTATKSAPLEDEITRLKALIPKQLEELQELRSLVANMETLSLTSAKEIEAKNQELERLTQLVGSVHATSSEEKSARDAKFSELENELAQSFSEREGLQRKSANAMKELENEVVRVYLEKVELEKQVIELSSAAAAQHSGTGGGSTETRMVSNGHHSGPASETPPTRATADSSLDDLFILLASLEIQCNTLRESLREAKGDEAVLIADKLSRQRGAVAI